MALKIKVVQKVVEHFSDKETHSVSPIGIDGVIGTHS
jgi:hypothetical protein